MSDPMRAVPSIGLLCALASLQVACLDQGFSLLNQEPWVQIDRPVADADFVIGAQDPVFEATVEDDKTETLALALVWSLADGTVIEGENGVEGDQVSFTVFDALPLGEQALTLSATDAKGETGTDTVVFNVVQGESPVLTFNIPVQGDLLPLGDDVQVQLAVTDADEGDLSDLVLSWDADSAGAGAPASPDEAGLAGWTLQTPAEGDHSLTATATDSTGLSGNASVDFTVLDPDSDGDGFRNALFGGDDCDDEDAAVNPDAVEACNGVDDDCDTDIDEDAGDRTSFYADADGDTWGDDTTEVLACAAPKGHVDLSGDCDDSEPAVNPDAIEICDDIDNDCNGTIDGADATDATTWYVDADNDGYGDPYTNVVDCEQPSGTVADNTDCDDGIYEVNPGHAEICDSLDNDCNGTVDDGAVDAPTWYTDADGDGYGDPALSTTVCDQPSNTVDNGDDCDDGAADVNPAATELCNGVDDNCDGTIDEDTADDAGTWYADADLDGFGDPATAVTQCEAPSGYIADDQDCLDSDATVNPDGTELCNGLDDNCDGTIDEDTAADASTWYADIDGDGYGDPDVPTQACSAPTRTVADDTDCDDGTATVNPGATELCNGIDDNCDGTIDEDTAADASTWYADGDGDGFGDPDDSQSACSQPTGTVANPADCDDADATISPTGTEVCDGADNDCDSTVDERGATDASTWYADVDMDGYGDPDDTRTACDEPTGYGPDASDCDDGDAAINPDATELCDSVDNDCDTTVDEDGAADASTWYADADGDGYGDPDLSSVACSAPSKTVADDTDCDDTNFFVNPGATERCNGADDNCDGVIDEDTAVDASTWYDDNDGDTYGDPASPSTACSQPANTVSDDADCDDSNAAINPAATELCDGVDNDCDSGVDENDADDATTWYLDSDSDGFGDPANTWVSCEAPTGYDDDSDDCDDGDGAVNPDATELCDSIDNDCDATIDEDGAADAVAWYPDSDSDGYGDENDAGSVSCDPGSGYATDNTDCDDGDTAVNPAATEICNDIDDNCDGTIDEDSAADASTWYADNDGDGYGDPASSSTACEQPASSSSDDSDCDDGDAGINPVATELCDSVDNDCDSTVDEAGAADAATWYLDNDSDGFGDAATSVVSCEAPTGYDDDPDDCDDADAAVNPDATELCDDIDNDCDSTIDEDGAADATVWFTDADGDGFGASSHAGTTSCDPGSGFSTDNTDCDDGEATTFPGADEVCDSVDSDCDSAVDEDALDGSFWQVDVDGDGLGDPSTVEWACDGVTNDWDCNDSDPSEPQVVDIATGSSGGSGALDQPWDTVQAGIDNAAECVLVLPGTYAESIDFGGRNLVVESTDGSSTTTLDGSAQTAPVVTLAAGETDALLRGFTLTGGVGAFSSTSNTYSCSSAGTCTDHFDTWWGGGLYIDGATVLLDDLLIQVNNLAAASTVRSGSETFYTYSFGGGVAVLSGAVTAFGVHVQGNSADQGGGIYVDAASTVEWITARIAGNLARDGAGIQVDGGSAILTNVLAVDNGAPNGCGGGVQGIGGSLTLTNVTVGLNLARNGDGLCLTAGTSSVVSSSIVYGDGAGDGVLDDGTSGHTQTYSTVFGFATNYSGISDPTGVDGNLNGDPLFTGVVNDSDFTNDDWHPDAASPTLDAGDPDTALNDDDGTVNDQGAYGGPFGGW